jgi:hypothetical protein
MRQLGQLTVSIIPLNATNPKCKKKFSKHDDFDHYAGVFSKIVPLLIAPRHETTGKRSSNATSTINLGNRPI